jgi:hypothetical protein
LNIQHIKCIRISFSFSDSTQNSKRKISFSEDDGGEPFLKEEKLKINLQPREETAKTTTTESDEGKTPFSPFDLT